MDQSVSYVNAGLRAVDGARRRLSGLVALGLAVVALWASLFGGVALYRAAPDLSVIVGGEAGRALDRLTLYGATLGLLYATAWGLLAYEARARAERRAGAWVSALAGLGVGLFGYFAAVAVAALGGAVALGVDASPLGHRAAGAGIAAGLILFQAGGEELFFRGWLQPLLGARWGAWIGLAATAALFAGAHAVTGAISPVAVLNDLLAGLVFGLLALRSGGLWAPFLAHWGWNWTEQALLGLTPNPGVDPLGSLFDLDLVGPRLLTGGADEMNGSIAATVSLLALTLLLVLWRRRPERR